MSSSSTYRALWLSCLPLLPVVAWQGRRLRRRIPRLPEASGPRLGTVGEAPALSIAVLGESTAASVGVEVQSAGLAHQLARRLATAASCGVRWQTVGKVGATIARARTLVADLEGPLDLAVLAIGVNDALGLTSGASWRRSLRAVVDELTARGARHVVFSSVPPLAQFPALSQPTRSVLGVRSSLLDALMRELVPTLPVTSHLRVRFSSAACVARDGFHPSALGYQEWADQLAHHTWERLGLRPRIAQ